MPTLKSCLPRLLPYLALLFCSIADASLAADLLPESPLPPKGEEGAPRNFVFVSDLHMGVGHDLDNSEEWHPTEDFRWHREFADFLNKIHALGDGRVDLVLLGDILELWQSAERPPKVELDEKGPGGKPRSVCALLDRRPDRKSVGDCDHPELGQSYGCNEAEAVKRTQRVVSEHKRVFEALGDFAIKGDNRVTLVPGNHDVALVFEGVRKTILEAIPHENKDPEDKRVRIATEGYWQSADGRVIAEHGQQIGADPNKFDNWPEAPFHDEPKDNPFLKQPWGEELVQQLFNCVEHDYPTVDNLASESAGLKYAWRDQGTLGMVRLAGRFLRFLLFQNSFAQDGQFLDTGKVPSEAELDLDKILSGLQDERSRWLFLAHSLPEEHPLRGQIESGAESLGAIEPFKTDEIVAACGRRWAEHQLDPEAGVERCPVRGDLGAVKEYVEELVNPRARKRRFRGYLGSLKDSLPVTDRPTNAFGLYVFGHTHKYEVGYKPFGDGAAWAPVVYNDGAWQRTATEEVFCSILKEQGIDEEDALRKTTVQDLPACYPFVTVGYDREGQPVPHLFFWVQKDGETEGDYFEACTDLPKIHEDCKSKPK